MEITYQKVKDYIASKSYVARLPKELILLKPNAKVMLLRNLRVSDGWVNGTIGFIDHLCSTFVAIHKAKNPESQFMVPLYRHQLTFMTEESFRKQIPLELAYAATVHKVQGQTLEIAIIHASGMFGSGMAYTACSRPRRFADLFFTALDRDSFTTDPMYLRFLNYLDSVDVLNPANAGIPLPPYPDMPFPKRQEFSKANPLNKKDMLELRDCQFEEHLDHERRPCYVEHDDCVILLRKLQNIKTELAPSDSYETDFFNRCKTVVDEHAATYDGVVSLFRAKSRASYYIPVHDRYRCFLKEQSLPLAAVKQLRVIQSAAYSPSVFTAVATSVFGQPTVEAELRVLTVRILLENWEIFSELFMTMYGVPMSDVLLYVTSITRVPAVFTDNLVLKAISCAVYRPIRVFFPAVNAPLDHDAFVEFCNNEVEQCIAAQHVPLLETDLPLADRGLPLYVMFSNGECFSMLPSIPPMLDFNLSKDLTTMAENGTDIAVRFVLITVQC